MPDWSYRTVLRPLLFALPADTARAVALRSMGRLAQTAFGRGIVDAFGHMRPDPRLKRSVSSLDLPGPIGIGAGLDPAGWAAGALAQFGVGFLEVGPIGTGPTRLPSYRRQPEAAGWTETGTCSVNVEELIQNLQPVGRRSDRSPAGLRIICRLPKDVRDLTAELSQLAEWVEVFVLLHNVASHLDWREQRDIVQRCAPDVPVWGQFSLEAIETGRALLPEFDGIVFDTATITTTGCLRSRIKLDAVQQAVEQIRAARGTDFPILISGGFTDPVDAVQVLKPHSHNGADLAAVDTGLVFSGPGLVKRTNELLLGQLPVVSTPSALPAPQQSWCWLFLMGISLLAGGGLAMVLAATRVVLPYDEQFVGMTRTEFIAVSPRLLPFMTHDRFTLAGTMIALAWLYLGLSWSAVRQGKHWAQVTMQASAFAGFFSFFLFLGFGYFDPFHAFVTAILFQFLLLSMITPLVPTLILPSADVREDAAWRAAQWGQLLYIVHGAVLLVAGLVISAIGATQVFVQEDLEFMELCAADLDAANPRLIPLIAHDRATFGGMLIATGVCVLLFSLWGIRRAQAWQWWSLTIAGGIGYTAAIGIHLVVGYTSFKHLAPAIGGGLLVALGSALLYPFLCGTERDKPSA